MAPGHSNQPSVRSTMSYSPKKTFKTIAERYRERPGEGLEMARMPRDPCLCGADLEAELAQDWRIPGVRRPWCGRVCVMQDWRQNWRKPGVPWPWRGRVCAMQNWPQNWQQNWRRPGVPRPWRGRACCVVQNWRQNCRGGGRAGWSQSASRRATGQED